MIVWRYLKSSFQFWFGLIWTVVGLPFLLIGLYQFREETSIRRNGIKAEATLVEKGHETGHKKSSNYWLRYTFHDRAGAEHVGRDKVGWNTWKKFKDGDAMTVTYLPEHPSRSRLSAEISGQWWVLPIVFGVLGGVFCPIGLILAGRAWRHAVRIAELLQTGNTAQGVVTGIETNRNIRINGRNPLRLNYKFTALENGQTYESRSVNLPFALENKWQAGDLIPIVYNPRNPTENQADLFDLRRGA